MLSMGSQEHVSFRNDEAFPNETWPEVRSSDSLQSRVFSPRGCLKTMVLVATEVEGNYKISKIIDIASAILNI